MRCVLNTRHPRGVSLATTIWSTSPMLVNYHLQWEPWMKKTLAPFLVGNWRGNKKITCGLGRRLLHEQVAQGSGTGPQAVRKHLGIRQGMQLWNTFIRFQTFLSSCVPTNSSCSFGNTLCFSKNHALRPCLVVVRKPGGEWLWVRRRVWILCGDQ